MIHIARGGTQLGAFSEEDVRQGLAAARFFPADLGWRAGMAQWQPLSDFPDLAGLAPAAAPVAGAHPPAVPQDAARTGLPWEHRQELGVVAAYFQTVKTVLLEPGLAFNRMRLAGGLLEPLMFRTITAVALMLNLKVIQFAFPAEKAFSMRIFNQFLPHPIPPPVTAEPVARLIGSLIGSLLLGPPFIMLILLAVAGLVHACLVLVGGAKKPYEATLRALCYAGGSVHLISLVPLLGSFIGIFLDLIWNTIALSKTHEISAARAFVAVLLPLLACCGLLAWFMIWFSGFIFQHAPHFHI